LTIKTALIADDEAHIRRVLEMKLKKQGMRVILAKDGQEALNLIHENRPDVVITDINMPNMDGKTLCMQTNPLKKEKAFLTIVVTARIDPQDAVWVSELQDTILMQKPFSPMEISQKIKEYQEDVS
jgi:DNA-binding response OmpR family regulator